MVGFENVFPKGGSLSRFLWVALAVSLVSCEGGERPTYTIPEARTAFDSAGLTVEESSEVGQASTIGATEGYNWTISGDEVEIYRFDTSTESGREALDRIRREGINEQRTIIAGNLAVVVFDHPDSAAVRQTMEAGF